MNWLAQLGFGVGLGIAEGLERARLARRQARIEGAKDADVDARTRADLDVLARLPPDEPDPPGPRS